MGFSDILLGSTKKQPGQSLIGRAAGGLLLENIFPGMIGELQAVEPGGSKEAILSYLEGNPVGGKGGLPAFSEIGKYNTLFEKYDKGKTTGFESDVFGKLGDIFSGKTMGNISSQFGSIGGSGGADINFEPPPNIGELTTGIMNSLPPQMQDFINNIFNDSSPEMIAAELDNFAAKITAEGQASAETFGGQLLSRFSSQGLGTGGSAMEGIKEVATRTAIAVNAQVAEARLKGLETMLKQRDIGVNLVNVLGSLGASEQANLVQGQIAELSKRADIEIASIQAQAELNSRLAAIQGQLELGRMDLLGNVFGNMIGESGREEAARIDSLKMPWSIVSGLAGLPAGASTQQEGILGGLIGAAGTIGGAAIGSALMPGVGTAIGAGVGSSIGRRPV